MESTITEMMLGSISASLQWFVEVMRASKGASFWLGVVYVWMAYRFLLSPIFGDAGSDKVSKSRKQENA